MKTLLIALMSLTLSASALAAEPSDETKRIARILVNNPDITQKLTTHYTDKLVDMQYYEVEPNVFQYGLIFKRICECTPATATVSVLEDLRPTEHDGSIVYTSTIDIKVGY